MDDVVVAAIVLKGLVNNTDPAIVRKHWAGDEDVLKLIQHVLAVADELIGSGLLKRIIEAFRGARGQS